MFYCASRESVSSDDRFRSIVTSIRRHDLLVATAYTSLGLDALVVQTPLHALFSVLGQTSPP